MILVLFFTGLVGGFFSGLLGIGGSVVLIPLMLLAPVALGVGELSMAQVAGLTMLQVLTASAAACLSHWKSGFAHVRTILLIGIPMAVAALLGAVVSRYLTDQIMLLIFGLLLLVSAVLLWTSAEEDPLQPDHSVGGKGCSYAFAGAVVGVLTGIVGAGGGFILIPVMIVVLGIPTRVAVGSSLGIVFISALMGSVGKIATLQVEWGYLAPLILASIPASLFGSQVSRTVSPALLKRMLMGLTAIILISTWFQIVVAFMPR